MPPAKKKPSARPAIPRLEWAVAALGLILTLGALAVIVTEAMRPSAPPDLALRVSAVSPTASGWLVEVEVENQGAETAAGAEIEGELTPPAGPPETAAATLDYAPGGGTRRVTLGFLSDPRAGDLELTARGWSSP